MDWIPLDSILIQFNSPIGLRFNLIQFKFNLKEIGYKLVDKGILANLLPFFKNSIFDKTTGKCLFF
jgi:hypothetical protein